MVTDKPTVPVLESMRKDPTATPQVKNVPALVVRKSAALKDTAVTATWEPTGPPHIKQSV